MATEEYEEETIDNDSQYVTRDELTGAIADAIKAALGGRTGADEETNDDGWEIVDTEVDDSSLSNFSPADIERIAEEKVQAAIKKLTQMKKAAPAKTVAKKAAPTKVVETEPVVAGKVSWSQKLWGTGDWWTLFRM